MKIKRFVLIALCLIILFSQTATAEDTAWKEYLRDFLVNNFPSLFDEATIKKNEEMIERFYQDENSVSPDELSSDISYRDYPNSERVPIIMMPWRYTFYDLDFDGIPEVIISFGALGSGMGGRTVYKLYGISYEIIGGLGGGENAEILYINPDNKIVSVKSYSTQFIEIKNKEIVYSEYIDSFGNDSYNGIKYSEIGDYSEIFYENKRGLGPKHEDFEDVEEFRIAYEEWVKHEVFLADLRYIPEFDCSDVVAAAKTSGYSPQTGDNYNFLTLLIVIPALYFSFMKIKTKIFTKV